MKIAGTISRVVEKNERASELANRVFMVPDDLNVFKELDGAKRRGVNEMAAVVEKLEGFKVGAPCVIDSETDQITVTAAPAPATPADGGELPAA